MDGKSRYTHASKGLEDGALQHNASVVLKRADTSRRGRYNRCRRILGNWSQAGSCRSRGDSQTPSCIWSSTRASPCTGTTTSASTAATGSAASSVRSSPSRLAWRRMRIEQTLLAAIGLVALVADIAEYVGPGDAVRCAHEVRVKDSPMSDV
jgi:hypothetical protein